MYTKIRNKSAFTKEKFQVLWNQKSL